VKVDIVTLLAVVTATVGIEVTVVELTVPVAVDPDDVDIIFVGAVILPVEITVPVCTVAGIDAVSLTVRSAVVVTVESDSTAVADVTFTATETVEEMFSGFLVNSSDVTVSSMTLPVTVSVGIVTVLVKLTVVVAADSGNVVASIAVVMLAAGTAVAVVGEAGIVAVALSVG